MLCYKQQRIIQDSKQFKYAKIVHFESAVSEWINHSEREQKYAKEERLCNWSVLQKDLQETKQKLRTIFATNDKFQNSLKHTSTPIVYVMFKFVFLSHQA